MKKENPVISKAYVRQNYIHRDVLNQEIENQYSLAKLSLSKEQKTKHKYTIQVIKNIIKNTEEWKDAKGYEGIYQVSRTGKIRRIYKDGEIKSEYLKPFKNKGYDIAPLYANHKRKNKFVHRIVAETFIPNPNNYPVVNHIDGDKCNNCVENLEWCTQKHNINEAIRLGLIKK